MIFHDINIAANYSDRCFFMKNGRIESEGKTEDVVNLKTSLILLVFMLMSFSIQIQVGPILFMIIIKQPLNFKNLSFSLLVIYVLFFSKSIFGKSINTYDDLGNELFLENPASRIIVLGPNLVEIFFNRCRIKNY